MPVELVNQPKCGVCGRLKGESNRWFLVRTAGQEFAYRDYDPAVLADYDQAVCGMECLDSLHHAHAQKLVGMRSVNESVTNPAKREQETDWEAASQSAG